MQSAESTKCGECQKKSCGKPRRRNSNRPPPPPSSPKTDEKPAPAQEAPASTEHPSGGLTAILQSFGGDRETMLLLALLFLLIKEEADTSLILALVYILL